MNYDAIVIGAGLFGSIISRAFEKNGMKVLLLDCEKPMSGSKPSACLMKPGWFTPMGKKNYEPALAMLDDLFGIQDIQFKIAGVKTTVHWVPTHTVLRTDYKRAIVKKIGKGFVETEDTSYEAPVIVVAIGVWSNDLVVVPGLQAKFGACFIYKNMKREPSIWMWAPYKHLKIFNWKKDELWVGDGSAIKQENYTYERMKESFERCKKALDTERAPDKIMKGLRPFVNGLKTNDPCYLKKENGVWVATGGAKNGLIAGAWSASRLLRECK